jgi:serine/threonine protein kinase/tetratricopeptide (TPR) repeat protein
MQPAIGVRVRHYELLRQLGSGAMGDVYLARDHNLGRNVAIKFLPARFSSDPERMTRFANEARAASSLNHPNIITIHEFGNIEGTPFLVMEYVEGQTLRHVLEGSRLALRRTLDIATQIAEGLAKAHAAGIVHRDLKPENLMITPDGYVKILDFGLAKLYFPDPAETNANNPEATTALKALTMSGMIVGTVGYMSPEQASGRSVDLRSDQFVFGVILYEMATGRRAFHRATPVQTLSAIIAEEPEPIPAEDPSFPAAAHLFLERCLAKDPNNRYTSTSDLVLDLRNIREHLSESRPVRASPAKRFLQIRPIWRWVALALGTVLLLFTVMPLREAILGPLQLLPLPSEKRIAVLPFRYAGNNNDDRLLCEGLLSFLPARLGQLERFQRSIWVVPAAEVQNSGAVSAQKAHRALGATLVVDGTLQRVGNRFVLTSSLIDAGRLRQLRATTVEVVVDKASLLEAAVNAIVTMLDPELSPKAQSAFHAGGTGVVEASTAYGQALAYTTYQQARTKLERYEQEQNLEQAISLFNEALRKDPRYALAHAGIGEAYWRLSRFTRKADQVALAEEHCRRALELDETLAEVWTTLGMLHTGTGRAEQAVQDLQKAIDRDPRNTAAYREQANAYRRLGREGEAEATYRKAIALDPNSWIVRSHFGGYLANSGRAIEAEQQYKEALKIVPDNARLWSGIGSAYYIQQKYPEAEDAWRRSLELLPTSTAASNLALHPFFEGRYHEAALRLERAIKIDDRDYRVWRNLAAAYYWSPGERQRAAEAYRRAAALAEKERALDPNDARVLADLADCYAMLQEFPKARAAATEAERLGGNHWEIAISIAEVYEQLGSRNLALQWVSAALKLGVPRDEIEKDPGLEKLRSDERYLKMIKGAAPARAN